MRTTVVLFIILKIGWTCAIPRGLQPSLATLYEASADFACLNGEQKIPFEQVNDDYCDCSDGSDEPGTSACSNGKFYCQNSGHVPQLLPSSRVNDGICDCCDGSDEYTWQENPRQGVFCQDNCQAMGEEARVKREKELAAAKEGYAIRQKLSEQAKQMVEESKSILATKEQEAEGLRAEVEAKRLAKEAAEIPEKEILDKYKEEEDRQKKEKEEFEKQKEAEEAGKVFQQFDTDKDGKVSKNELMTEMKFDTNNDGIVSDEEVEFYLAGNQDYDKDSFIATGWPLIKPIMTVTKSHKKKHHKKEDPDRPKMWNEAGQEVDEEGAPIEHDEFDDVGDEYDDYDDQGSEEVPDGGDEAPAGGDDPDEEVKDKPKYDEASQALIDAAETARTEHTKAERRLSQLEEEMRGLKETIDKDYGENGEFLPLKNQCFEFRDNEYVYKMCPFESCTQQGLSGGGETRLGTWERWEGPEDDPYSVMKFSHGQSCWNGPSRSTVVLVVCGAENVVESVTEPNKCEYEMVFSTPAICKSPEHYQEPKSHDEL